ncbi:hypothetical protein GCM10011408_37340 [Dyella caseinilytica]|nr:hypothetical protein GCM10011408_37340 [Dyella caseinilytica]
MIAIAVGVIAHREGEKRIGELVQQDLSPGKMGVGHFHHHGREVLEYGIGLGGADNKANRKGVAKRVPGMGKVQLPTNHAGRDVIVTVTCAQAMRIAMREHDQIAGLQNPRFTQCIAFDQAIASANQMENATFVTGFVHKPGATVLLFGNDLDPQH